MRVEAACPCGKLASAEWPDEVDAVAAPHLRRAILDRTLDRIECPACGRSCRVEAPLLYRDPSREGGRGIAIRHRPGPDRPRWRSIAAESEIPLVFGINDLVERILALEHGLEVSVLEVMKTLALLGRTDARPPRTIHFEGRPSDDRLSFVVVGPAGPEKGLDAPFADYVRIRDALETEFRPDPRFALVLNGPYQNYLKVLDHTPDERLGKGG